MLATVVVVYTHNLAIGVLVGVLLSGIFFAGKIAQIFRVTSDAQRRWPRAHLHGRGAAVLRLGRGFMPPSTSARRWSAW
jgi:MFS superfamily sulfate permease-like transporter